MIRFKDLQNKVYSGKNCTRFEFSFLYEEGKTLTAFFYRQAQQLWKMQIIFGRTQDRDNQVYTFNYVMPRENLPLELIAATGLRYFQYCMKEEIQEKSNIDFMLGDILEGM